MKSRGRAGESVRLLVGLHPREVQLWINVVEFVSV